MLATVKNSKQKLTNCSYALVFVIHTERMVVMWCLVHGLMIA